MPTRKSQNSIQQAQTQTEEQPNETEHQAEERQVIAVLLYVCEKWRMNKNSATKLDVFLTSIIMVDLFLTSKGYRLSGW